MENLSMQMVAEITAGLDHTITEFINNMISSSEGDPLFNKDLYDPKHLVYTALKNALDKSVETQTNPLSNALRAEKKYRKYKKERWYASVLKNVAELDYSNPKHPFCKSILIYQNSSIQQKEILFPGKSLSDIISDLLEEARLWSCDTSSYLISFPGIQSFSRDKIYENIISDILIDSYRFITEHYDGNIRNYKQILPDSMLSYPFFGEKKEPLDLKKSNDLLVEKLLLADNSIFQTVINPGSGGADGTINGPNVQSSFDQTDLAFFQYGMFANIDAEFYGSKSVTVPLLNFAKLMNKRPNKQYLNRAVERLSNYPHKTYSYIDKERNIVLDSFNLIDRVQIINPDEFVPTDDSPYASDAKVIIVFGDKLYEEIINEQLTLITKASLDMVSSGLSKLLCPVLQRERTLLTLSLDKSKDIDPQMTRIYQYSFFARSVRTLGVRKSAKNIERLTNALKEFKDASLFIKGIALRGDTFRITFYPLTDDERADIDFHWNKEQSLSDLESQIGWTDMETIQ